MDMFHDDWAAWDRWMEANDHLVQQGVVPSVGEITMKSDFASEAMTDRDFNIAEKKRMEMNERNLEESRIAAMERE